MEYASVEGSRQPRPPRTLLMYAFYFPPCLCYPTASARAAGFARYLPVHGWDPIVITRDLTTLPCDCDDRRVAQEGSSTATTHIDGVEVIPIAIEPSRLKKSRDRLALNSPGPSFRPFPALQRKGWTAVLNTTEGYDSWVRDGIRAGEDVIRVRRVDAVWTTTGPYRSISIGRYFAKNHQVPWVADLRDSISRVSDSKLKVIVPSYLKRRAFALGLRRATQLVEVTPQERLRDLKVISAPIETIPSGFDSDDWASFHSGSNGVLAPADGRFVVAYTGHVVPKQNPAGFFRGLRRFVETAGQNLETRINYYGPSGASFIEAARGASVQGLVHDHGMVSVEQARLAMAEADALLLLSYPGISGVPGGKLYEYLASTTPVLVTPAGDEYIEGLLAFDNAGLAATTPQEIANALKALAFPAGSQATSFRARVEQHGWSSRAKMLAQLLDEVVPTQ